MLCSRCPIWRRELDGALAKRAERLGADARSADLLEGRLLANKLQTEADTVTGAWLRNRLAVQGKAPGVDRAS